MSEVERKSSINGGSGLWVSYGLPVRENDMQKIQARGQPKPQSLNAIIEMIDKRHWIQPEVGEEEVDQRGYVPVFVWSWVTRQAQSAEALIDQHDFVNEKIREAARHAAIEIDDQISSQKMDSMLWSLKWTRKALELITLFVAGARSWSYDNLAIIGHSLQDWLSELIVLTKKRLCESGKIDLSASEDKTRGRFGVSPTSRDQHQLQSEGAVQICHLRIMMLTQDDEWEGVPFEHKVDERGYVPVIFWQWIRKQASSSTEYTSTQTFNDEKCKARAMFISKQIDSKIAADKIKSMIWSSKWTQRTLELLAAFTLGIQDFSISDMGYWGPGSKWISGLVKKTIRRLEEQEGGLQAFWEVYENQADNPAEDTTDQAATSQSIPTDNSCSPQPIEIRPKSKISRKTTESKPRKTQRTPNRQTIPERRKRKKDLTRKGFGSRKRYAEFQNYQPRKDAAKEDENPDVIGVNKTSVEKGLDNQDDQGLISMTVWNWVRSQFATLLEWVNATNFKTAEWEARSRDLAIEIDERVTKATSANPDSSVQQKLLWLLAIIIHDANEWRTNWQTWLQATNIEKVLDIIIQKVKAIEAVKSQLCRQQENPLDPPEVTNNKEEMEQQSEDNPKLKIAKIEAVDKRNEAARAAWYLHNRISNRKRSKKRSLQIKQVWRGEASEVPDNVSIVTKATVNDKTIDAIFDTAAQVTVISMKTWQTIGRPKLEDVKAVTTGADGTKMSLKGAVKINISIGGKDYPYRAWVIDGLHSDLLLGFDFMRDYPTDIMLSDRRVKICGNDVKISWQGWQDTNKQTQVRSIAITLAQDVLIPPKHGIDPKAILTTAVPTQHQNRRWEFKPIPDKKELTVARGVMDGNQTWFNVRLANFSDTPTMVARGTTIGYIHLMKQDINIFQFMVEEEKYDIRESKDQNVTIQPLRSEPQGKARRPTLRSDTKRSRAPGDDSEDDDGQRQKEQAPVASSTSSTLMKDDKLNGIHVPIGDSKDTSGRLKLQAQLPESIETTESSIEGTRGALPVNGETEGPAQGTSQEARAMSGSGRTHRRGKNRLDLRGARTDQEYDNKSSPVGGDKVPNDENKGKCQNTNEDALLQDKDVVMKEVDRDQETSIPGHENLEPKPKRPKKFSPEGDQHSWGEAKFKEIVNELMLRLDHLSDEQQKQMAEIVTRHSELWISPSLGEVDYVYDIEIQPWHPPLKQSDRRWSQGEAQLIKQNIDELMTKGFIRPTRSPWASRLVLVPKPDGSTRVCVDYRQLNTITMTDAYPTPRVDITRTTPLWTAKRATTRLR